MLRKPKAIKIEDIASLQSIPQQSRWTFLSRSTAVILPLTVMFILLFAVTASVQLNAGAQSLYKSEANVLTSKSLVPPRGLFYDVSGQKLTTNVNSYTLSINPTKYDKAKLAELFDIVSNQLQISVDDLAAKLTGQSTNVILATGLTSEQSILLGQKLENYPVSLITDVKRNYLFPEPFAQVLGYTGKADLQDLKNGLAATDQVGKYRLEKVLDEQLRGVKGRELNTINGDSFTSGVPGNNVFLTIDAKWQQWLYKILGHQVDQLGGQSGAVVISDVSNGDIRAYTSYPSFDSNQFSGGISNSDYQHLLDDPRKPLVDKVIGTQTSPGSTYKLIAAYAAIQNKVIDANYHIFSNRCMDLGNYPFCEFGHFLIGDLDVTRALARSSNIFFCDAILKLTKEQGYEKYVEAAQVMGMGQKTGIMLDGELAGILATPETKLKLTGQTWFDGDICNSIIGQGITTVTPLQMVSMVSTFFNGGKYYQPNVISRIEDQQGNVVQSDFHKLVREVPMSDTSRELVQAGMYYVVNTTEGTDYWYLHQIPLNFYAKTGSAETVSFKDGQQIPQVDGWIVGKFDYQGKTYSFAADIRFAGGGWNASQVIMRFGNCLVNDFADGCDQI